MPLFPNVFELLPAPSLRHSARFDGAVATPAVTITLIVSHSTSAVSQDAPGNWRAPRPLGSGRRTYTTGRAVPPDAVVDWARRRERIAPLGRAEKAIAGSEPVSNSRR